MRSMRTKPVPRTGIFVSLLLLSSCWPVWAGEGAVLDIAEITSGPDQNAFVEVHLSHQGAVAVQFDLALPSELVRNRVPFVDISTPAGLGQYEFRFGSPSAEHWFRIVVLSDANLQLPDPLVFSMRFAARPDAAGLTVPLVPENVVVSDPLGSELPIDQLNPGSLTIDSGNRVFDDRFEVR
jgi:hypothetical protein